MIHTYTIPNPINGDALEAELAAVGIFALVAVVGDTLEVAADANEEMWPPSFRRTREHSHSRPNMSGGSNWPTSAPGLIRSSPKPAES